MNYNLAQINIAQGKAAVDSEIMHGFVSRIEEINAIADKAPGFIWRLQTEEGDSTAIKAFDDPTMLVNMSTWQDVESLKKYVYNSFHVELIKGKKAWFDKIVKVHQVMWWIPAGTIPTIEQAKEKLVYLQKHGSTEQAFTFAKHYNKPCN